MCGRYAHKSAQEPLAEWFDLDLSIMPWFAPSYNVAPQSFQSVVLLSRDGSQREAAMLRWGLVPSWAKDARRPKHRQRRGRFDVVLVWASDRIARSVKHFLDVLDELNRLGIEYVSFRENIDTGGPLGRALVVIIGAIAELERNLIIEGVRAGMRRACLEGQHIGRNPLELDNAAIHRDRRRERAFARSPETIAFPRPPGSLYCASPCPGGSASRISHQRDAVRVEGIKKRTWKGRLFMA